MKLQIGEGRLMQVPQGAQHAQPLMGWQGLPISTTCFGRKPSRQLTQFTSGHSEVGRKPASRPRPLPVEEIRFDMQNNIFLDLQPLPSYRKAKSLYRGAKRTIGPPQPGQKWPERRPGFQVLRRGSMITMNNLEVSNMTFLNSPHFRFNRQATRCPPMAYGGRILGTKQKPNFCRGNKWELLCIGLLACIVPPGT